MEIQKERYSINEVSEMLGINVSTLRSHEKEFGLIVPRDERQRRYYTEKEIEIFELIRNARNENHSIDTIRTALAKQGYIEEQRKSGLQLMPMDQLTPAQLNEIQEQMLNTFSERLAELVIVREKEMQQKYEEKLSEEMSKLKESIKEELQVEFTRNQEQAKNENQKLMDYIEKSRETDNSREDNNKKSLFSRLFGK